MNHQDLSWLTQRPIAHRGFHDKNKGIIENCPQAFDRAIEHDFAIELDVQVTSDGKAAVFHDYSLERLTHGSGRIDAHEMAELSKIAFRDSTDHMLELPELLTHIDGRVPLVIELKTPVIQDGRLEKAVAEAIADYQGKVALMSFSPLSVEQLIPLTDRPRGITACNFFNHQEDDKLTEQERYHLTHMLHAPRSRFDFVSYCISDLPVPSLDLLKALYDMPVICWTTKSEESHHKAMQLCDQVTFEGYDPDNLT